MRAKNTPINKPFTEHQTVTAETKTTEKPKQRVLPSGYKDSLVFRFLPFFIYATFIGVIYIWNTFYTEKKYTQIEALKLKVDQLRIDYRTLQYDYLNLTKRTKVDAKVKRKGLYPTDKSPIIIEVEKE